MRPPDEGCQAGADLDLKAALCFTLPHDLVHLHRSREALERLGSQVLAFKQTSYETRGRSTDDDTIWLSALLQSGGNVRCLTYDRQLFAVLPTAHFSRDY